ncbi:glycosyltransferase family 25 protein [Parvibaculum sp.]|uniref:glycosyltransferase family 25 protein n=1 Tax=Parvibaculum sp. TaxID=2024848 RepID=UPI002CEA3F6F|nr:glycosyltransferase family 25 protein [Parvibaculum sp.]HUD50410.1 glycosyltransferase family 25 protein [Parvibaculum sp.]
MNVQVINLDRHPSRLERMTGALNDAGIIFQRVPAMDGKSLTDADISAFVSQELKLRLSPSEVACMLSHREAWRRFLATAGTFCCVLEDDVRLSPDFGSFLSSFDETTLPAFDVIKIETMGVKVRLGRKRFPCGPGFASARLCSHHHGTAGYIVGRRGAERLLALTTKMDRPLDDMMFDEIAPNRGSIKILQLVPALCIQEERLGKPLPNEEFASSIDPDRVPLRQPRKKRKRFAKIVREIGRPLEYLYHLPARFGTERVEVAFGKGRILQPEPLFPVESTARRG